MNDVNPDALFEDLARFRNALEEGDFSRAGATLPLHDARLRQYIRCAGVDAPVELLRELLQLQHRLREDMQGAHARACAALYDPGHQEALS
jgi:hypothetical protein